MHSHICQDGFPGARLLPKKMSTLEKKKKKSKGEDSPKLKRIYQEHGPMAKEEELCVSI